MPCRSRLGHESHPKVTLVGKGICFDTGGLDIKPPPAMALMKKDMAGAASVMALGAMIMAANLPVRLRILVPAADNNISGNAFRPGDIIKSRAGLTVEIANTDAEGRLVLADALALADEESPDLLIDMATLTGAARVALGPDLPPSTPRTTALRQALYAAGLHVARPGLAHAVLDALRRYLKSKVADVNHIFNGPFAGSITAALFLKRFVKNAKRYVHLDIFGWVPRAVPSQARGRRAAGRAGLVRGYPQRIWKVGPMTQLDPRLNPFREDLAAASLQDRVRAPRYAEGELRQVAAPAAPIRVAPRFDAPLPPKPFRESCSRPTNFARAGHGSSFTTTDMSATHPWTAFPAWSRKTPTA